MASGPQRTTFGSLTFDATLMATNVQTSEITDHPVETGANPSDHIRQKPETVDLEIIFSPLQLGSGDPDRRGVARRNTGGGFARKQLDKFFDLQGQALTLIMPWRKIDNMVISSISTPVNAGLEGFKVRANFKQMRFVSSGSVRFNRTVPTKTTKPTGKNEQGKKAPVPETPELRASAIKRFTDWTGGTTAGSGVLAP